MIRRVSPQDLISTARHSQDFRNSRAEYISIRIRILAYLFAALALLWIPIDFVLMPEMHFEAVLGLRLGFSTLLILLGTWSRQCNRLRAARARVALFLFIPGLFYFGSHQVLGGLPSNGVLIGYSFLPFLMVALLAVVPLTLLEGIFLITLSISFFIVTNWRAGSLFTLATMSDFWLLSLLALIALWVEMTQLHMLMRLYREATRDALTGLVNRRVLYTWLDQEVNNRTDKEGHISVLLFDLDLFKRINDTYGHLAGDAVLQTFARVLQTVLPPGSLVGRYGGEEFLAILPSTDREAARQAAESVREACHGASVRHPDNDDVIHFTTSTGVAERRVDETAGTLLGRVDQGLYEAKESGRDLVAVAK
ncbi:GGDEF domain-containing protein [Thiohalomonas denitrificans]|uniref:GGDEF domain-containing protein n=1 Tax=Thiohalomonas denitrificans TaxID=415747 RepID=UPI0026EBA7EC|nr:GGDEF domain-containing protein [Thiohalomonas denitrificans]